MIGALLLLASATPFALTSCDNEHEAVNITLKSDYSGLAEAMKDNNKSLLEKLGMIEEAIKNGNINDNSAQELLLQALNTLNGTLDQKLAAIEEAIKGQTTSLETKLGLIQAAINGGFANDKAALDLIKAAIGTLNGTVSEKLAAIEEAIKSQTTSLNTKLGLIQAAIETGLADNKTAIEQLKTAIESIKDSTGNLKRTIDSIVSALDDIKGALDTDIAALLQGIRDSIDGLQDYSEILTAIKTAIENIGQYVYKAGPPAEAVDLGLPSGLKWASYNLGASKPEEYGDYFAWGETKPYYTEIHYESAEEVVDFGYSTKDVVWRSDKPDGFRWSSYFDTKDGGETFEIYDKGKDLKLRPEHDAAHVNWGGGWRMPTVYEMRELKENSSLEWTEMNGVKGCKLTGPNGNFIFLPAAGAGVAGEPGGIVQITNISVFWTSQIPNDGGPQAGSFFYQEGQSYNPSNVSMQVRRFGLSIRPVCP